MVNLLYSAIFVVALRLELKVGYTAPTAYITSYSENNIMPLTFGQASPV
jgi:hypothetical protein